jgi:hypothetical protein
MVNSVPATGLTAEAVFGAVNLTVATNAAVNPCLPYLQVGSYEIWASTTNDRTAATKVGTAIVPFWQHTSAALNTQYWYWTKTVDASGAASDFYPSTTTSTVTATPKTAASLSLTMSASAIVVPADAAGNVTSFTGAVSTAKVLDGTTDVTASWTFSAASTGVTVTQSTATFTLTAIAGTNGYFDVSAVRAGYPTLTARVTVSESPTGATGAAGASAPALRLSVTSQVFQVAAAGVASPTSVTFTASLLGGLSGTPTFSVTSGTATLTGSGLTRALAYTGMSTDTATIQATLSGSTDTITIAKVREGAVGAAGTDAITALLSNEAHTLQADASGTVSSFTGAVCTMSIYQGIVDSSASWTVSRVDGTGITSTLATRTVTVTAMSADSAFIDLTAARTGYASITKRFTVTKSKQGVTGTTGTAGTRGSMTFYVSGQSVWSDTVANTTTAAAPNGKQLNDVVTQYNASTFSSTRSWNGSAWVTITQAIDGNLLITGSVGATQISASYVYAGTISADQINAGTFTGRTFRTATTLQRVEISAATNDLRFYNSGGNSPASIGNTANGALVYCFITSVDTVPAGLFGSSHANQPALRVQSSNTAPAIDCQVFSAGNAIAVRGTASSGAGNVIYGQTSSTASGCAGWFEISNTAGGHALRGLNNAITGGIQGGSGIVGVTGSAGGFALYAERGTVGPFTGAHDGLLRKTRNAEVGDILCDLRVVAKPTVSDAITEVARSSAPRQAAAVGVFVSRRAMNDEPPAALAEFLNVVDASTGDVAQTKRRPARYDDLPADYDLVVMNSVGEGCINVVAEGGDIAPGDFITSSSRPGKGMRQEDGIMRNYTVARAREGVTFNPDRPNQVEMIACIYLCG